MTDGFLRDGFGPDGISAIIKKFSIKAQKLIQDAGVILRSLPGDAIGFCPPLIILENQINEMFDRIESVMPELDTMANEIGG